MLSHTVDLCLVRPGLAGAGDSREAIYLVAGSIATARFLRVYECTTSVTYQARGRQYADTEKVYMLFLSDKKLS